LDKVKKRIYKTAQAVEPGPQEANIMTLLDFLREQRENIAQQWLDCVFQTYPLETVGFLRKGSDPFANPVAVRPRQAIVSLTAALLEAQLDSEEVAQPLDDLIRVRSVQDFCPSQAVAALYFAKTVIRNILEKDEKLDSYAAELVRFESKIDTLALLAMDIYDRGRNPVHELRIKESKNKYSSVMRLAKLTCDLPARGPDGDTQP